MINCDELRGKYLVVTGEKRWSTNIACDYRIIGALYLTEGANLETEARKYVFERDSRWAKTDNFVSEFSYFKNMQLYNGLIWTKALLFEHQLYHNWFGFIPAENVAALFEPRENFKVKAA
ncbi:MAG: hypothetical protein QXN55_00490 [Candidatus Nitrosotenuis sp.]